MVTGRWIPMATCWPSAKRCTCVWTAGGRWTHRCAPGWVSWDPVSGSSSGWWEQHWTNPLHPGFKELPTQVFDLMCQETRKLLGSALFLSGFSFDPLWQLISLGLLRPRLYGVVIFIRGGIEWHYQVFVIENTELPVSGEGARSESESESVYCISIVYIYLFFIFTLYIYIYISICF